MSNIVPYQQPITWDMLVFGRGPGSSPSRPMTQARVYFQNGYGASIIVGGYGNAEQPYELAVMYRNQITYGTPITDDVIGYLTELEVLVYLNQIRDLPAEPPSDHAKEI